MTVERPHIPVMLDEVLAALAPKDGEVYVDGTFGAGGYTRAILEAADCKVIAIDRDATALARGAVLAEEFGERLTLVRGCFGDARAHLDELGVDRVNGFVLDIGVSSMQLDEAERGFSFRFDAPLDMRMDAQSDGLTAADIVNETPEEDLANIIYRYGEERMSRRIARKIVERRAEAPIATTFELADIVRSVVPKSPKDQIDPATRTFQALRIAVNDELGELERALGAAASVLAPAGRLVIVSFHSLEDSLVKSSMREQAGLVPSGSRYLPDPGQNQQAALFTLPSKKAVFPTEEEMRVNPRARSARLRCAVRTNTPLSDLHDVQSSDTAAKRRGRKGAR